ncbi:MAG: extracellular solute-binding protein [Hyphomicrobiales bacterium]
MPKIHRTDSKGIVTCFCSHIKNGSVGVALALSLGLSLPASANTRITFANYLPNDYINKVIKDFEAAHPDIQVQSIKCGFADCHRKLTTALAVGQGAADIFSVSTIKLGSFANSGGLMNLSAPPFNIAARGWRFDPSMISLAKSSDGHIYGVPYDTGPVIMIYRNDMVRKAGVKIEDITKSWDRFIAFGERLKKEQGAYLIPAATSLINPLVVGMNGEAGKPVYTKNGKPNLDSPQIKQLMMISRTLYDKGLAASLDGATNSQEYIKLYRQGKLFCDIDGPWDEGRIEQELDPDGAKAGLWRVTGVPGNIRVNAGGTVLVIPKQSKNPQAAWQFIQFFMQRNVVIDAARIAGTLPARLDVYDAPYFDTPSSILGGQHAMRYYVGLVADLKPVASSPEDDIANEILNEAAKKILMQHRDIDSTLRDANKLLQRRMRAL